jgi:hypothetical protein
MFGPYGYERRDALRGEAADSRSRDQDSFSQRDQGADQLEKKVEGEIGSVTQIWGEGGEYVI